MLAQRLVAPAEEVLLEPREQPHEQRRVLRRRSLRLPPLSSLLLHLLLLLLLLFPQDRLTMHCRKVHGIAGGLLVQSRDNGKVDRDALKVVTKRAPTDQELKDCLFAWTVAKHVKSNAIVYAKGGSTAGVGAGQMNRLESARIAAWKAKDAAEKAGWSEPRTIGSAVASDAFFPFAWGDSVEIACQAGVKAIAHPGGSMRDQEAVDVCNKYGVAPVTTGHRHFRH